MCYARYVFETEFKNHYFKYAEKRFGRHPASVNNTLLFTNMNPSYPITMVTHPKTLSNSLCATMCACIGDGASSKRVACALQDCISV